MQTRDLLKYNAGSWVLGICSRLCMFREPEQELPPQLLEHLIRKTYRFRLHPGQQVVYALHPSSICISSSLCIKCRSSSSSSFPSPFPSSSDRRDRCRKHPAFKPSSMVSCVVHAQAAAAESAGAASLQLPRFDPTA